MGIYEEKLHKNSLVGMTENYTKHTDDPAVERFLEKQMKYEKNKYKESEQIVDQHSEAKIWNKEAM